MSLNRRTHRFAAHLLLFTYALEPAALAHVRPAIATPAPIRAARPLASSPGLKVTRAAPEPQPAHTAMAMPALSPIEPMPQATQGSGGSGSTEPCASDLTARRAPTLSVTKSLLWPPNHSLVDVGANVTVTPPCESRVTIGMAIYSDEPDEDQTGDGNAPGDVHIQPPDVFLRSERKGNSDGRVYLLISTAALPDGTAGVACETVVVPHSQNAKSVSTVREQATAAKDHCTSFSAPPSGYVKLAEGVLSIGNQPPVVDAGADQAIDFPGAATLDGSVSDDGRPNGSLSVQWSKVSGPGDVTFNPADQPDATASFSAAGTYLLRLTASDSQFSHDDDVTVVVSAANTAPDVEAGSDQEIPFPTLTISLAGQATDDGRPSGTLVTTWSVASGPTPPGPVSFGDASALSTTATFALAGDYVLLLTADDGQFQVSDSLRVTIHPEPVPIIQASDGAAVEGQEGVTGAVLNLTLSSVSSKRITVEYMTADDTATAGCDYRTRFGTIAFEPGQSAATVVVPIVGELTPEVDERLKVRLGNPTQASLSRPEVFLTIQNDDGDDQPPTLGGRAPMDGATAVPHPVTLSWSAIDADAGDALSHDVYLGTTFGLDGQSWTASCPVSASPSPRSGALSAYDEARDRLIVYGGEGSNDDTLWILTHASGAGGVPAWTALPAVGGPVGLQRAATAYDAARGRLIVYGGCTGDCSTSSDVVWFLANANGLGGAPAWSQVAVGGPGARVDHAAAYDVAGRRLIVFGGASGASATPLNDLWTLEGLDGTSPTWQAVPASGSAPAARAGASLAYDSRRNRAILFGGRDGAAAFSDVWLLDGALGAPATARWTRVVSAGGTPASRWGHAAFYEPVGGRLLVWGGSTAAADPSARFVFGDAWMLADVAAPSARWIRISPGGAAPTGRVSSSAAYSQTANRFIAFGGRTKVTGNSNEVWILADAAGSLPLVSAGQTESTLTADSLVAGPQYYWRVVSRDSRGAWRGSTAWSFTSNAAPVVEAGVDQEITLPASSVSLAGSGSDDGLPAGVTLTYQWTASGPAPVSFADATSLVTMATFSAAGTYTLSLSVSDSQAASVDALSVIVRAQPSTNQGPLVNAGTDQLVALPALTATLSGTVTDDGLPAGGAVTLAWRQVSGAGVATFGAPTEVSTPVTFSGPGVYVLRLEASDGDLTGFDELTVTVGCVTVPAEARTYRSRPDFLASSSGYIRREHFDAYPSNAPISELFGGLVAVGPSSVLYGGWAVWGAGEFAGGGLIPEPRFQGRPIVLTFNPPVAGLGAHAYDDGDGSPFVNVLTLTATTSLGNTVSVAEDYGWVGDTGFLGVSSLEGIVRAEFTIDTSFGNFELDLLTVASCSEPPNQRPTVNAGPDRSISLPTDFVDLSAGVVDDGKPSQALAVSWSQLDGPASAVFADASRRDTRVTFPEVGTYVLRLTASDGELVSSDDVRVVLLAVANQPPTVGAGPDRTLTRPADTLTLEGAVSDDGLPWGVLTVGWIQVEGPPGQVTFSAPGSPVTSATFGSAGNYVLSLRASDGEWTTTSTVRVSVTTAAVNQAPMVGAGANQTITLPNLMVTLSGSATDDGLPAGSTLVVGWTLVSGPASVGFGSADALTTTAAFDGPGVYVLRLTASDGELSAASDVTVTVQGTAAVGPPPSVSISSPLEGDRLSAAVPVAGSVASDSLLRWTLDHRRKGDAEFVRSASGTTPVSSGPLGVFDPSLLLNGIHEIRLTAIDTAGRSASTSVTVTAKDNLKVGHFSVAFVDLEVPVAGLPIRVTRTYDSRDKQKADFGHGWRMDLSNVRVQESGSIGYAWQGIIVPGYFPTYCLQPLQPVIVTVTLPDGRVLEFDPVVTPQCQQFIPIQDAEITFRPRPGTLADLRMVGDNFVFVEGAWPGVMQLFNITTFEPLDPGDYALTFPDGRELSLSDAKGLTSIRDLNGNTLTVSADGIRHSSGAAIAIVRDAGGRIREISDPEGHSMSYAYDGAGDLASFTDRETNTTRFTYAAGRPHHLETIDDALGRRPIRNEYYDDGRIKSHTDAFGKTIRYEHDTTGRQELVYDRNTPPGLRVLGYDDRGNVVSETDQEGKVVRRTFNGRNNRKSETVPHDPGTVNPPATLYGYENEGTPQETDNVAGVTDPEGRATSYTYDARGQVRVVRDARGNVTENTYDGGKGNLLQTEVRGAGGVVVSRTAYTYWPDGNVRTQRTWTDIANNLFCETSYEYFPEGRLKKEVDPTGHATEYTYDRSGNRRTQRTVRTLGGGQVETLVTEYVYDRLGRLVKTIDPDGTYTEAVYDEFGRQKETFDKRRRRTAYEYDEMGRLFRTTYADLTTEETTYWPEGQRKTLQDRRGKVTSYEYDKVGRLLKTTFPGGAFTENVYDAAGRLEVARDARGKVTQYEYFDSGQRKAVNVQIGGTAGAPIFARTSFTYDGNGSVETTTDPKGKTTTFVYDVQNRRTRTLFPPAAPGETATQSETRYDAAGRRVAEIDQAGKLTRFGYDCLGRLDTVTQVNDGIDLVTTYGYDELGNRTSQTDANDHTTLFEYDALGRETRRILPDTKSETKTYWPTGALKTRTDFMGRTTSYEYDINERLQSRSYAGSGAASMQPVSFTYTPTGRRETVTLGTAVTGYEYDDRDRLMTLAYPDGRKLEYEYDENGNRKIVKATVGGSVLATGFTYDDANRLDLVTDPVGRVYDHGYDANGNRESLSQPNGTVTGYAYDDLNRLKSLTTTHPASGVTIQSYAFTLASSGSRTKITEGDGTVRDYTYDDLYRLTGDKVTISGLTQYEKVFTYDRVGNRKTQATIGAGAAGTPTAAGSLNYAYDSRDRLETENGTLAGLPIGIVYGYDDNGNLLTRSGEATYTWDIESRLIKVTKTDGTVVDHVYDADRVRVQTTTTLSGQSPQVTNYLVDTSGSLSHVVAETDAAALKAYYVRGDDLLAVMRPLVPVPATAADWQTRYVHADGIGSIRRLTDENGQITDGYTYTAFGELLAHTGTDPQPYAFAGEPYDPNVGFQYHRARWMDPRTGRFASMDDFLGRNEDPRSLHRYLYAGLNPVSSIDPTGRFSLPELGLVSTILTGLNAISLGLMTFSLSYRAGTIANDLLIEEKIELEEALYEAKELAVDTAWEIAVYRLVNFEGLKLAGSLMRKLPSMTGRIKLWNVAHFNARFAEHYVGNTWGLIRNSVTIPGGRVPDFLTNTVLREVKNVIELRWSGRTAAQLADYADHCVATGKKMFIHVRGATKVDPRVEAELMARFGPGSKGTLWDIVADIPESLRVIP